MTDALAAADQTFRRQYGRMVAALVRVFGSGRLALVEDVVQEALVEALRTWPFRGVPARPDAWLVQVAKNRALDRARRERLGEQKLAELARWTAGATEPAASDAAGAEESGDDALRLMFTCCHPQLGLEAQVALTLKTLCGFGVAEIARALLATEAAIAQRLVRAKALLAEREVPFTVPEPAERPARLDAVLEVLYLLFNEGHAAHQGEQLVREDLAHEALRLADLIAADPRLRLPKVHALRALFLLQGARLGARRGPDGELLTLARQDRRLWNRAWIADGLASFERSIAGDELSPYHAEAAIAAVHAQAACYGATDWPAILAHYDLLVRIDPSPVAALNRAVALAKVSGPDAGRAEVERLAQRPELQRYHLLHAVRGLLLWSCGEHGAAAAAFDAAAEAEGGSAPERALSRLRAARCRAGAAPEEF